MAAIKFSDLKPGATFNTKFGVLTIMFKADTDFDARLDGRGGIHFERRDLKHWLNFWKIR